MQAFDLFSFGILIMSVIVHEIAHGYMALSLGDSTAKYEGRLTINPLKHIDPVGSIIVPLITSIGGVTFGWAKPVPFNPYNLRNKRWGEALVAVAGPASNIALAIIFAIVIRFDTAHTFLSEPAFDLVAATVLINIALAFFNLLPVPPLDGSKILFSLFPQSALKWREAYERFGFILLLILIFFVWRSIVPVVFKISSLFTGLL